MAAALALAAPSAVHAQGFDTMVRIQELEAQVNAARQRDIALRNELMAAEARSRAEASVRFLEAERNAAAQRRLPSPLTPDAPNIAAPAYAAIPDARLSDSNARVRSAAEGRR